MKVSLFKISTYNAHICIYFFFKLNLFIHHIFALFLNTLNTHSFKLNLLLEHFWQIFSMNCIFVKIVGLQWCFRFRSVFHYSFELDMSLSETVKNAQELLKRSETSIMYNMNDLKRSQIPFTFQKRKNPRIFVPRIWAFGDLVPDH